jgi:hypothetical protein
MLAHPYPTPPSPHQPGAGKPTKTPAHTPHTPHKIPRQQEGQAASLLGGGVTGGSRLVEGGAPGVGRSDLRQSSKPRRRCPARQPDTREACRVGVCWSRVRGYWWEPVGRGRGAGGGAQRLTPVEQATPAAHRPPARHARSLSGGSLLVEGEGVLVGAGWSRAGRLLFATNSGVGSPLTWPPGKRSLTEGSPKGCWQFQVSRQAMDAVGGVTGIGATVTTAAATVENHVG